MISMHRHALGPIFVSFNIKNRNQPTVQKVIIILNFILATPSKAGRRAQTILLCGHHIKNKAGMRDFTNYNLFAICKQLKQLKLVKLKETEKLHTHTQVSVLI